MCDKAHLSSQWMAKRPNPIDTPLLDNCVPAVTHILHRMLWDCINMYAAQSLIEYIRKLPRNQAREQGSEISMISLAIPSVTQFPSVTSTRHCNYRTFTRHNKEQCGKKYNKTKSCLYSLGYAHIECHRLTKDLRCSLFFSSDVKNKSI